MALSRALLKGMNLTEEQVQAIIDAHRETVDGLKDEAAKYKEGAEKLTEVQKELDALKKTGGDWQKKYDDEHKAYEDFKKDVESKEALRAVKSAYRKLLSDNNVGEKHLDSILRVTDFSGMKLDKDGKLENADKLTEAIKKDWSGFISTEEKKGASIETPPGGSGGGRKPGRGAEIAKKYHEDLYGKTKEE